MKKIFLTLSGLLAGLLISFCVTACDDDDENASVDFPKMQSLAGASDSENLKLTFDAPYDWTLTSDAAWCYFVTQQEAATAEANTSKELTCSGKAGKPTVWIGISSEGQDFEKEDVAHIKIQMNGETSVLAEVKRSKLERKVTILKKIVENEGAESWVEIGINDSIVAGYDDFNTYKVVANFNFHATYPEWLSVDGNAIVGQSGNEVTFGIKVVDEHPELSKYTQEGNIDFQDEDGNTIYSQAVKYEGMDPEKVDILESPASSPWNWNVSMDGKEFKQADQLSGSTVTKEGSLEWTIAVRNDDFKAVFVEKTEVDPGAPQFRISLPDPAVPGDNDIVDWIHEKINGGKIQITVDPTDTEREGYVLVFPKAVYDEIANDPWENLIESTDEGKDVKYAYLQNYLLINFTQKASAGPGEDAISIVSQYWENYGDGVKLGSESDLENAMPGIVEFLKSEYNAQSVYSVKAADCSSVRINLPFKVTSLDQISAVHMSEPSTYGEALPKGPDGNIGLTEDGVENAVDLWQIQETTDMILVNIHAEDWSNSIVIVVMP